MREIEQYLAIAALVAAALAVLAAGLYGAATIYRRCARHALGEPGAVAVIIALVVLAPWLLPFGGLLRLLDRQPAHEDARRTVHTIN